MLGSLRAVAGRAATTREIKITARCVRPSILHSCRQHDRLTFDQFGSGDIYVVVRQIGPHVCIEGHLSRRHLGGSQSRCGHTACDKREESSAAEHGAPPKGDSSSLDAYRRAEAPAYCGCAEAGFLTRSLDSRKAPQDSQRGYGGGPSRRAPTREADQTAQRRPVSFHVRTDAASRFPIRNVPERLSRTPARLLLSRHTRSPIGAWMMSPYSGCP